MKFEIEIALVDVFGLAFKLTGRLGDKEMSEILTEGLLNTAKRPAMVLVETMRFIEGALNEPA